MSAREIICRLLHHELTPWSYEAAHSCVQKRRCALCGRQKEERVSHEWKEMHLTNKHERVCTRCRKRQVGKTVFFTDTRLVDDPDWVWDTIVSAGAPKIEEKFQNSRIEWSDESDVI
jgi:hypothetical protein